MRRSHEVYKGEPVTRRLFPRPRKYDCPYCSLKNLSLAKLRRHICETAEAAPEDGP